LAFVSARETCDKRGRVNPALRYIPAPLAEPLPTPAAESSLGAAFSELTKARLTVMVLLTTLAGFYVAGTGPLDWPRLLHTLLGTALVAVCSSVLNQALERRTDALMRRTEMRPFVTRRLPYAPTILGGCALGVVGLAELAWFVNGLTALLAFVTLAVYVVVYTPLKRLTPLNTLIGAVPGALPALLGATASTGRIEPAGLCLFALLAAWQLPHFYAIAFMYRDDYERAGLRMVSVDDPAGRRTAFHAVVSGLVLLPVSLLPVFLARASIAYGVVATLLSLLFLRFAVRFVRDPARPTARALFLASIAYLPLMLLALVIDAAFRR
jgi:protoheme IX farnesyltransferase